MLLHFGKLSPYLRSRILLAWFIVYYMTLNRTSPSLPPGRPALAQHFPAEFALAERIGLVRLAGLAVLAQPQSQFQEEVGSESRWPSSSQYQQPFLLSSLCSPASYPSSLAFYLL